MAFTSKGTGAVPVPVVVVARARGVGTGSAVWAASHAVHVQEQCARSQRALSRQGAAPGPTGRGSLAASNPYARDNYGPATQLGDSASASTQRRHVTPCAVRRRRRTAAAAATTTTSSSGGAVMLPVAAMPSPGVGISSVTGNAFALETSINAADQEAEPTTARPCATPSCPSCQTSSSPASRRRSRPCARPGD